LYGRGDDDGAWWRQPRREDLELFQRLSVEHGFRLAGLRSFDKALEPEHWARYIAQFSNQSTAVEQEIA